MTFSYTPSASPDDITRVRYHIGDTVEATAIFDDETITMIIAEEGSWQLAVIDAIKSIIAKIAGEPNFTADWLRVDYATALAGYQKLLALKAAQFGVSASTSASLGSSSVRVTRSDWDDT
ncbi:MAG: hypothetical protein SFZ02_19170 [bacterium]|nr:hypothetical protein [bacterium]